MTASAWQLGAATAADESCVDGGLPALIGVRDSTVREFAVLYDAEFGRLAGYLARVTGDHELAREAAQEAFTRLFSRWRKVREPRAFVYAVGTNLCRHSWRQAGRERSAVASLAVMTSERHDPVDPTLRDLVDHLPARHREVVLLHYYADLPLEEVAAAVHRPLGTVKRRLHEARGLLARAMEDTA